MAACAEEDSMQTDAASPSCVQKVLLCSDAYYFCMQQCLSTEVEEVMGLLIGELDESNGHCRVTHTLPLKRLDKRKDRVEIGIEQLGSSFSVVDELNTARASQGATASAGQVKVVGWYHSHPHITVFPSEVDIATHHQYQSTMSQFWLGLIFGVFNYDDNTCTNRFQLIAFQSIQDSYGGYSKMAAGASANGEGAGGRRPLKHVVVPIEIEPRSSPYYDRWTLRKAASLIDLLLEEEKEAFLFNQGEDATPGEETGRHYNACVYSKAVAKVIALLGAPLIDVLKGQRELATRLKLMK